MNDYISCINNITFKCRICGNEIRSQLGEYPTCNCTNKGDKE